MRPLNNWLGSTARFAGVFTDIDDTLTTEGAITADALTALADLKAAGLHVIPITGRPVGCSEPPEHPGADVLTGMRGPVDDPAGLMGEGVPDARPAAVFGHRAFDLVRSSAGAEDEVAWQHG